jgi:hypothetical protein
MTQYEREQIQRAIGMLSTVEYVVSKPDGAGEALRVINHKDSLLCAAHFAFREIYKQLLKAKHDLERYGRRIREQKEDILDLLAKLDGATAGQETLQKALAERSNR